MGGTSSKSEVEVNNEIINRSIRKVGQNCSTSVAANQVLNIEGNKGAKIKLGDVNLKQVSKQDIACFSSDKTTDSLKTDLNQQLNQKAEAKGQVLSLSKTDAENYSKLNTTLTNEVIKAYSQTCSNTGNYSQFVNIRFNDGSEIKTGDLNFDQTITGITNCLQKNEGVVTANNNLKNFIDQKSTAETKNPFSFLTDIVGNVTGFMGRSVIFVIIGIIVVLLIIGAVAAFLIFSTRKTAEKVITPENLAAAGALAQTAVSATPTGRTAQTVSAIKS